MIDVPVEVKEALQDGRQRKNYRFNVLNDDGTVDFTIDNNTLVSESVNIDERMCSGDTIKFGLCEGSSLEFQYFNHPNIKGRQIQVFIDVYYVETVIEKTYETLYECHKYYEYELPESSKYYVYSDTENNFDIVWLSYEGGYTRIIPANEGGKCFCEFTAEAGNSVEVEFPGWGYDPTYLQIVHETRTKRDAVYTIPMGYFTAEKCSRQASTGIIKVTAYNKLQSSYLDAKANQTLDDLFLGDPTLTTFDIRNALLGHYQIIEKGTPIPSLTYSDDPLMASLSTDFRLTSLYGIKALINGYELRNVVSSPSDPFRIMFYSLQRQYPITQSTSSMYPGPKLADAIHGLLLDLEQNCVNYLKKLIDEANITYLNQPITGDDFIDLICANIGFDMFFSVARSTTGTPTSSQTYSTIQYDYEERKGITHAVGGRIQDVSVLSYSNTQYYYINVPNSIVIGDKQLSMTGIFDNTRDYYEYYTDSSMIDTARGDVPYLTFSDGTKYEAPADNFPVIVYRYPDIALLDELTFQVSTIPEFTLRDLMTALYETECQFGKLDRETDLFSGVELNTARLLPADNLYPENTLYPGGAALSSYKSMYSKLWADEGKILKWRYLIITYKGLESGQEKEFTLQRTVNADGNVDYNMSDNWLFKNLTWTSAQIANFADAMVPKMQNITWFPFEMWCAGLPYLETGDEIEVSVNQSTYPTYILQRQLKGIQNLQDTYINGTLDIF